MAFSVMPAMYAVDSGGGGIPVVGKVIHNDETTHVLSGSDLTAWNDASGNGNHWTSPGATGASVTTTKNGLDVVTFGSGGSNDLRQSQVISDGTGGTLYMVLRVRNGGYSGDSAHAMGAGGGSPDYLFFNATTSFEGFARDGRPNIGNLGFVQNTWYVYTVVGDATGTFWKVRLNGTDEVSQVPGANTTYAATTWYLGGNSNNNQGLGSLMAEVIVYNVAHDDTTISGIESTLATKWDITF